MSATVLVIDDSDDVRSLLRMSLERDGFEIVGEATNGVDGVLKAIALRPMFVIVDHLMPRLDGEGVGQILRALFPDLRLISFSALLSAKPSWADHFLRKEEVALIPEILDRLRREG